MGTTSKFVWFRRFALLTTVVFMLGSFARAQQITGSVTGTVTDPGGAAVNGATVKLTNAGTGAVQTANTDSEGNFRFLLLPPGTYSLNVSSTGFKSVLRDGLIVEVDRSLAVPISMQIGQVSETVEVSGASPLLEPNSASLGTVMQTNRWKNCR